MDQKQVKDFLDRQLEGYYQRDFILNDPISLPHQFTLKQDIEIIAFWIAMLSWGRRNTIIKKGLELLEIMDYAPYDFILHHNDQELRKLNNFKHRTFQPEDALYFLAFLKEHYRNNHSLESAFGSAETGTVKERISYFHNYFFDLPYAPSRTRKHIANPAKGSASKRLNMFLRWMVRKDEKKIDFGIWNSINPSELMIPLDVHVGRVARKLGLLHRKNDDWKAVEELTENLRRFNHDDPVIYDYALFSIGLNS